jgi:ssDNA-binding Zn-finger/Zn-ribbon topoisomerase 1
MVFMPNTEEKKPEVNVCPKCNSPLGEITVTKTGRKLQRCSKGSWDPETKKNVGCDFVKWLEIEPETLDEKCPKCSSPLILATTRFGKKMKKCSTGVWNSETKKVDGCDYVEWINGTTEQLDEECPDCGEKLVLFTTNAGKKMKKCSTAGWDSGKRVATGCKYVYWLKPSEYPERVDNAGEEFLPPEPEE